MQNERQFQIIEARRKQAKLRIGLSGPSGSGKTYSALLLAYGLVGDWSKIVIIDTENASAQLYSNLGPYKTIVLQQPYNPERYIAALKAAEDAGVEAVVIDSVSPEWDGAGGLLEANELLAATKFRGNTWAAWSETTPRHQRFLAALTSSPCHIITTSRSKTDTIQTEDKKIKKVGLKEIQREGYEYELTVNFNIDRDRHYAIASKDRTSLFSELDPFVISVKTGEMLKEWNEAGEPDTQLQKNEIVAQLKRLDAYIENAEWCKETVKLNTGLELDPANYAEIIRILKGIDRSQALVPKTLVPAARQNHAPNLAPQAPETSAPAARGPMPQTEPEPAPQPAVASQGEPDEPVSQAALGVLRHMIAEKLGSPKEDSKKQAEALQWFYGDKMPRLNSITELEQLLRSEAKHITEDLMHQAAPVE